MIRHSIPPPFPAIPEEDIRKCAYYLWLESGRPSGRDLEFWHAARERLRRSPAYARINPGRRGQKVRKAGQEARSGPGRNRLF